MAALQKRNGSYRVLFNYLGKQRTLAIGSVSDAEANAKLAQIDYLLMRLRQGLLELPVGVSIGDFLKYDGAPPKTVAPRTAKSTRLSVAALRDRYLEAHSNGTLETHTLNGIRRHFGHLTRILGPDVHAEKLRLADLQDYVNARARQKGRRGLVLPTTIRKEIVSLGTAWKWAVRMELLAGRCPVEGLRFPKEDEKPPFQSRAEIERQIPGLSEKEAAELWDVLYLDQQEVESLLDYVRSNATHPWLHPMLATAAYTGARRGELLRMRISDLDLNALTLQIREKKRVQGVRTMRRVPLAGPLVAILKAWLAIHPGGPLLFAAAEHVHHSRKRSRLTGYSSTDRPTTEQGRREVLSERESTGLKPLTENEVSHHLKRTLASSDWRVIHGYHILRHSFISACASKGIDQRLIDEWVGHQSDEQRRRYRHLYPSVQASAINQVFGS